MCAKTERALPIAQDSAYQGIGPWILPLLQDPATGRLIYHFCEQLSKVDLRSGPMLGILPSSLGVWCIFASHCSRQMVTACKIKCTSLADFKSIQSECCGCGCDGPLSSDREEWRSCSEVTLNELWRYDIKGNKWEFSSQKR